MYIIFITGILVTIFIIWLNNKNKQKNILLIEEQYRNKIKQDLEQFREETEQQKQVLQDSINIQKQREVDAIAHADTTIELQKQKIDEELNYYKQLQELEIQNKHENLLKELSNHYTEIEAELQNKYNSTSIQLNNELNDVKEQITQFKAVIQAINEENRRKEEIQNNINTHRIQLTEDEKQDIEYLISIEKNIHNKELLYKLIWSSYLMQPFNKMIVKSFGTKIPKNVIYCIEEISTQKKYIGKTSTEVSKRWTDHIKNSLNIGTIKQQPIHKALFNHWDEFTFFVLEEVTNDKLGEREKFYINLFQTDKFGFNIKSGG